MLDREMAQPTMSEIIKMEDAVSVLQGDVAYINEPCTSPGIQRDKTKERNC